MKVLVTGATGFVGSTVVAELQRRGHGVTGVARSDETAAALVHAGAAVHRGDVTDPDSIVAALGQVDGVVHTAFNHDFSKYFENSEADAALLDALARNLIGTTKALVATSATTVAPAGSPALECADADPRNQRSASERFLSYAEQGVRASLVRLPAWVHGKGDKAFVPALIKTARETGMAAYVDDGVNRWSAAHRFDAARLFCDAVEQARSGVRYHGVAVSRKPSRSMPLLKRSPRAWAFPLRALRLRRQRVNSAGSRCSPQRTFPLIAIIPANFRVGFQEQLIFSLSCLAVVTLPPADGTPESAAHLTSVRSMDGRP